MIKSQRHEKKGAKAQRGKKGFEGSWIQGFKQPVTRNYKPETRNWGGFNHEEHDGVRFSPCFTAI